MTDGSGQPLVATGYAERSPVVGTLDEVLAATTMYHLRGIRTGLTRLRKGEWQINPRGFTA